nr:glycosyltransferase family 2 protein [Bacteroidales bacterium]
MDKLSVILITRNEQANIERCLKSILPIADEIVVVDSGSTDATQYICSKYSVRWHSCEWKGFGEQKNYANSLATYDYVFSIDADEELSPQLCESIRTAKIEGFSGIYSMNRLARYANRWI